MSDGTTGLLILVAISIGSAAAWHSKLEAYLFATVCAAATSVALFQIIAYLHAGYLDPFFFIALVTSSLLSLAISLVVGIPFHQRRQRERARQQSVSNDNHAP